MTMTDVLLPAFLLLVGIPCLFTARQMQRFVLSFNERFGHVEPADGFRRSPKYLGRLRLIGLIMVCAAALTAFAKEIASLVI
jgi:hypothetical protein